MATQDAFRDLSTQQRYRDSVGSVDGRTSTADRRGVMKPFRHRLIAVDGVLLAVATLIGLLVSSRETAWEVDPLIAVYGTPVAIAGLWWVLLALRGSYDQRIVGLGTEEIRRVVSATTYTFAVIAGVSFLVRADISRAYVFVSLPLGMLLIVAGRFSWRGWLYRQRLQQRFMHRTVVVGSGRAADDLVQRMTEEAFAGYLVVERVHIPASTDTGDNAWTGWLQDLGAAIDLSDAEAVAVAPSHALSSDAVRQLAWFIEARPVDLLIAPAVMEAGGTRLSVRPAAGLPLLHLDEVSLTRPQRFAKRVVDLVGASVLLVLLGPLLIVSGGYVRITSRGPVLFRQLRVGRAGKPFTMLKFRTMVDGSDAMREDMRHACGLDDPLFKLVDDPRITPAGRVLRRWSLDELPQLLNVLSGSMSLVGPRPHPLDDVSRYETTAYRRLALKPGMTGLWQVEGRNGLSWQESLQLDLHYVETWSLSGDLALLARTVRAVLRGHGAL